MRIAFFIGVVAGFVLMPGLTGQVIDTSKAINTWKLEHNFTRFEGTPLDTNMHQLHREYHPAYRDGFSYEYLGILGHALNHVDFFRRPGPRSFLFGRGWEPYLKKPERTTFFNTRTPFTSLSYSIMPFVEWREENVEALHTQNTSPFTNFGIEFNILAGKELYTNEATRANRIGLFGSHARNRYSIFGTFYYNDFRVQDHGGLADLDAFLQGTREQIWEYEMRLPEAGSHYRNLSLFTTQKYNLLEREVLTDSLGNTTVKGKTLSLSHQLYLDRHVKDYSDNVVPDNLSPLYREYYYFGRQAKDSASEDRISNVFQVILGDPDYDPISARIYAGHELRRFGHLAPHPYQVFSLFDTVSVEPLVLDSVFRDTAEARFDDVYFNDLYVGGHLAGPTTGIWDWVLDGKYYLAGYNRHDFEVHATFSREFRKQTELGLRGTLQLQKPHYFTNRYASSFFQWQNDFPSLFSIRGEVFIRQKEDRTRIRAGVSYMSNYIYWDVDAVPQLYGRDILLFSGSFSRLFRIRGLNSDNNLLLQYSTAGDILHLPLLAYYTSNYWEQSFFKGALVVDLGIDFYITTRYHASAYMPPTGIFHLQDEREVGGYPYLDAFVAFRIKRTRVFLSYSNLLHGLGPVGNNFFTVYRYPMKPRHLRLGLVWTFYD